jgi:hypothetical protein
MERNELKGKQTQGAITYEKSKSMYTSDVYEVHWSRDGECTSEIVHGEANASLYAEAHNVANQTGLWPMDLVERVKALEKALLPFAKAMDQVCAGHSEGWAERQGPDHALFGYNGFDLKLGMLESARAIILTKP